MRQSKASGWIVRNSSSAAMRALRLAVVPLGIALVVTAGPARAGDDQDDRSISEKIADTFKSAVRGSNMDNRGIDYRERSPLVVPPKLDLPPPAASSTPDEKVTNWPKDPDERQRKAIIAAKKKNAPPVARVQTSSQVAAAGASDRPINIAPPPEDPPVPGTKRPAYANDNNGTARIDPVYDQPGDLFGGGASALVPSSVSDTFNIGSWFGGKKADATAITPGSEPTREALTQPPSGYQTPSPNYPYAQEAKGLFSGQSNPDHNPAAQMSSASSVVH